LPKKLRGWSTPFEDPISLPSGRQLVTLKDAANYIMMLPKAEQKLAQWQAATEALIMAAERRGPLMHARIGVLKALNVGKPAATIGAPRKRTKAYRIVP
jgi:hypothetical protein